MSDYKTPGVYVKEIDAFSMSVVGVDTAIPVFVGPTKNSAKDSQGEVIDGPVRIDTLAEYIEKFGKADAQKFTVTLSGDGKTIPYKLDSVALDPTDTSTDLYYQMQMFYANGGSTCYVYTTGATTWGNDLAEKLATKDDITMVVLPETFLTSYGTAIENCAALNRLLILGAEYSSATDSSGFREKVGSNNLQYAAAYTPYLDTSLSYVVADDHINVTGGPSGKSPASKLIKYDSQLYNQILAAVSLIKVSNLSPTGAMAGVYAKTDRDKGVWIAPANIALNSVVKPSVAISAQQQDSLNVDATTGKSINAIRYFPGKGNLVWGARTLDGNSNDWRYVSVRRLISYIEDTIQIGLQNYVFQSNTAMTWLQVRAMIESFLENLWQQGALAGSKMQDAFYVNVGLGTTMTSQDILDGTMRINIGLAAVRPAEFIVLNVTQLQQQ